MDVLFVVGFVVLCGLSWWAGWTYSRIVDRRLDNRDRVEAAFARMYEQADL